MTVQTRSLELTCLGGHKEIGILNSCTNSSPFVCFLNTQSCDLSSGEPDPNDVSRDLSEWQCSFNAREHL